MAAKAGKDLGFSILLDYYGMVLTEKQRNIFGNSFKPYKVRFNFSKKRKRFFLLKKILNETRNFAVSFSESGKVFYFTRNRMK